MDMAYSQMRRFYGYGWREFWLHCTLAEITAMLKAIAPEDDDESGAPSDAELAMMGF